MYMKGAVSHDRKEETLEAKARWFQSLSLEERMDLLCAFTDLILEINPRLPDMKDDQSPEGNIQILSRT